MAEDKNFALFKTEFIDMIHGLFPSEVEIYDCSHEFGEAYVCKVRCVFQDKLKTSVKVAKNIIISIGEETFEDYLELSSEEKIREKEEFKRFIAIKVESMDASLIENWDYVKKV